MTPPRYPPEPTTATYATCVWRTWCKSSGTRINENIKEQTVCYAIPQRTFFFWKGIAAHPRGWPSRLDLTLDVQTGREWGLPQVVATDRAREGAFCTRLEGINPSTTPEKQKTHNKVVSFKWWKGSCIENDVVAVSSSVCADPFFIILLLFAWMQLFHRCFNLRRWLPEGTNWTNLTQKRPSSTFWLCSAYVATYQADT